MIDCGCLELDFDFRTIKAERAMVKVTELDWTITSDSSMTLCSSMENRAKDRKAHILNLGKKLHFDDAANEQDNDKTEIVGQIYIDHTVPSPRLDYRILLECVDTGDEGMFELFFRPNFFAQYRQKTGHDLMLFSGLVVRVRGSESIGITPAFMAQFHRFTVDDIVVEAPFSKSSPIPESANGLTGQIFKGPFYQLRTDPGAAGMPFQPVVELNTLEYMQVIRMYVKDSPGVVVLLGPFLPTDEALLLALPCSPIEWYTAFFHFIHGMAEEFPATQFVVVPGSTDVLDGATCWPNAGLSHVAADVAKTSLPLDSPDFFKSRTKLKIWPFIRDYNGALAHSNVHMVGTPAHIDIDGLRVAVTPNSPADDLDNIVEKPQGPNLVPLEVDRFKEDCEAMVTQRHLMPAFPPSIVANYNSAADQACWLASKPHLMIVGGVEGADTTVKGVTVVSPGQLTNGRELLNNMATFEVRGGEIEVSLFGQKRE